MFVLNLGDDENRFSRAWMTAVSDALDEVDAAEGPRALLTIGTGKFWSNGLDLDWLTANLDQAGPYVDQVQALAGQQPVAADADRGQADDVAALAVQTGRFGIEHNEFVGMLRLKQKRVIRIAQARLQPGAAIEQAGQQRAHRLRTRRGGNDRTCGP